MASRIWMSVVVAAAAAITLAPPRAAAQQLSVGAGAGTRYQLSRVDGEAQLHRLARSASTEEAWLLAGDVWIVIGYKGRRNAVSVDLSVVTSAVELAGAGTPLAFYHLHPFHEDPRAIEPPSLQDVQSLALMKELYGPVGSFYACHAVANEQGARGRRKTIVKVERRTTVSPGQSNINAGGN